jgi:thiamine biosynthesis lipoprotein
MVLSAVLLPYALATQALDRFTYESAHMGTAFRIVAYGADSAVVGGAADRAFAQVARLDSLLSHYRVDSEVVRISESAGAGVLVSVSSELWSVLSSAQQWAERTDGAFDVTIGPLTRLWRWSGRRGELPDTERLAAAQAAVGHRHLILDGAMRGVRLTKPGMSLDLGGIAKGYAADVALRALAEHGVRSALVDAGGDLALGDAPPGESGWMVALPNGETVRLARAAVATSGDTRRFVTLEGVRYSHIVDPRTGLGAVDAPTVTVVARDATTADALASALSVMDAEPGRALVDSVEGVWAYVIGSTTWTSGARPARATSPLGR